MCIRDRVTPGQYEVTITKKGYQPQIATVEMKNGEVTNLDIVLEKAVPFSFTGMSVQDEQGTPLEGVYIQLSGTDTLWEVVSDQNGQFTIENNNS